MAIIQRIYISGPISKGVFQSQMLNWAELLAKENIETHFLVFYHSGNQKEFNRMIPGNQLDKFSIFKYLHKPIIKDLIIFWQIFRYLRACNQPEIKTIIQTRSILFVTPLILLKYLFDFKFVYEIRGVGEEGELKKKLRTLYKRFIISLMLKKTDELIAVSNNLIKYKEEEFSLKKLKEKTLIISGAADNNLFYYNKELRLNARKSYNLEGKIVFTYVGSLNKPWQIPNKVFELVFKLKNRIPNLFFLVITPDKMIAETYAENYHLHSDDIAILEVPQDDLNYFLNASDFGLLLRENLLVNRVAAPTKFAEYLLSGVPVIISEAVGDYSSIVKKHDLGLVIDIANIDYESLSNYILPYSGKSKEELSRLASKMFSKQFFLQKLKVFYQKI